MCKIFDVNCKIILQFKIVTFDYIANYQNQISSGIVLGDKGTEST
jgi:hypothetical protein